MADEMTAEEQAEFEAMQNDAPEPERAEAEPEATEPEPEQSEPQAEFKTTREKPPEGFVPHQAMHAERARRQEAEQSIAELRARLAALETPPAPKDEPPQWVDPLVDPEGFNKYQKYQEKQVTDRLDRWEQQQKSEADLQAKMAQAAQFEAEYIKTAEDYPQAAQFLHQSRAAELQAQGFTQQQVQSQLGHDAVRLVDAAVAAGLNPAHLIYERARAAGYKKPVDEGARVAKLAEAQRQTASLPASGAEQRGALTAEQVGAMSDDDFQRALKERPDDIRRIMGG